jgi:hypothetical protein
LAGVAFCSFLVGCNQTTLIRKLTPPEDESIVRSYVNLLMQGKYRQIENALDPSVVDANTPDTLAKMSAMFPTEPPKSIKVVGVNLSHGPQYAESNITLEYEFPNKWLLANVDIRRKGPAVTIVGFHVDQMSDSLENINKFKLAGKSPLQYSILALAVGSLVFSLSVFILCIRTKDLKRKWLWALCTLVGVEKLAVNWGTGQLTFGILAVYIPCVTATHPPYGPVTLGVCIPLGAILFLYRRKKLRALSRAEVQPLTPAESGPTPD